MKAMKKKPRYHVVSLRISDEEREAIDAFAQRTSRSISQLMREAMVLITLKMDSDNNVLPRLRREVSHEYTDFGSGQ
ncbi:MAG: ribbon-helix-helix protein, CopG family [Desulfuromonadales bacterium]|nr:ribbon-helix-helix protein, CopG family [Desulfuromonadales bacterium]